MKMYNHCDLCGKGGYIKLTAEQSEKVSQYHMGDGLVQELFPELNPCEREFIKTGMCMECQKMMFGKAESKLITER